MERADVTRFARNVERRLGGRVAAARVRWATHYLFRADSPQAAVDTVLARVRNHEIEASTARHHLRAVIDCVRFIHGEDVARSIVYRAPRVDRKHIQVLSPEELCAIREACNPAQRVAFDLGRWTGMRWSEVRALRAMDVDRSTWTIRCRSAKGGRPRIIPVADGLRPVLETTSPVMGYVSPIRATNATYWTARVGKRAGVKWHFHQLRHTRITELLRLGWNRTAVRLISGHSSDEMLSVYEHPDYSWVAREIERVGY